LLTRSFNAAPILATFTATEANRLIEVIATGDNGGSRLSIQVLDSSGAVVASADNATTNVSRTTLSSGGTDPYTVTVTEKGVASSVYYVYVREEASISGTSPDLGGADTGSGN
jgi:hypothetical protein